MLAHDNLLISQEHRLRERVEKLEVEKNQFDQLAAEIQALKRRIK